MPSGRTPKGARLWLEPGRKRAGRKDNPSVWIIRDGAIKRSTGCGPADRLGAERALQDYLVEKHQAPKRNGDPASVLIADVLALFARDIAIKHLRPKETQARITRLIGWWADPEVSSCSIASQGRPTEAMTGTLADVRTATCHAYVRYVGYARSGSIDLELLRAAINHAHREQLVDRPIAVALPPKSLPRERWLTRAEVAKLIWLAWRSRRVQDGTADDWGNRKHIARFMVMAYYTGTRKTAILNASFERQFGAGYLDLDAGLWYRRGAGVRATKKRQPPVPLPAPLLGHLRRWRKSGQTYAVEFDGRPVDRIDKAFRSLVVDSGLGPDVVPHTFRHTAITWGMQNGMDPWEASGYFGLNLQTLIDTYGHHHPNHLREAAAAMARPRLRRQVADRNSGTK